MRITLANVMASRIPQTLGKCADDFAGVAAFVNEAQQRLINAGGETGWFGGWYEVAFNVPRTNPYITCPPDIARLVNVAVCGRPILIQNQWYEYLWANIGLQSTCPNSPCTDGLREAFERGTVPMAYDFTDSNQYIRVYVTDSRDVGAQITFSSVLDQNGNGVYETDGESQVNGFVLTYTEPFSQSGFIVTSIGQVSKGVTYGDILVYQVDATTGVESLLARYKPWETNPSYRRYYLNSLPLNCCNSATPQTAQVKALAKLEYVPVQYASDFLLIGNIPALKEECLSVRYGEMDTPSSMAQSAQYHRNAVKLLNDELTHYLGKQNPAISVAPFGSAKLERHLAGFI